MAEQKNFVKIELDKQLAEKRKIQDEEKVKEKL